MASDETARVDALCKVAPRYRLFTRLRRAMFQGIGANAPANPSASPPVPVPDSVFQASMTVRPWLLMERELTDEELWLSIQALVRMSDARKAEGLAVHRVLLPESLPKRWRKWYSVAEVLYG